ncbi:MAG: dipeptidase [Paracoccaceae bacterium]
MSETGFPLMFDGHNDVLLKLYRTQDADPVEVFSDGTSGHIDMAKVKRGGFGGGFFANYVPSEVALDEKFTEMQKPVYDLPLPDEIPQAEALPVAMAQAAILSRLEAGGALRICRTVGDIRECLAKGTLAAIMHIEGAEAIDTGFDALEVLHRAGLRSLGPVWSRPNAFGHGVPFRFPSDGDTGPGLTGAGKELVRECNRLGIMIDLSHLNMAGFRDVAKISNAPLVATHSNAHAICPHARNLTDDQLSAIRDSDGMVGINFAVAFLRPDGQMSDTGLDTVMRHLDHLIGKLGDDRVGFGSDFDGAVIPSEIGDCSGLPALRAAMAAHGIDDALMRKLCHGNWLRVLGLAFHQ